MLLNLATHPFENRRRFYVLALVGGVLVAAATVLLVGLFIRNFTRGRGLSRQMITLGAETTRLSEEQKRLEEMLKRPEVVDVMNRSQFLNSLIRRKSISWTQIFMDLEKVMPERVQVTSVRPVVEEGGRANPRPEPAQGAPARRGAPARVGPGEVDLQMTVSAESIAALVDLLRRMEKSEKFYQPVLQMENPPLPGGPENLFQLQLSVLYAQK